MVLLKYKSSSSISYSSFLKRAFTLLYFSTLSPLGATRFYKVASYNAWKISSDLDSQWNMNIGSIFHIDMAGTSNILLKIKLRNPSRRL